MEVKISPNQKADWLIIFLILDTIDIARYLNNLFEDLKDTKLKKTTKIYFLQDTVHRIIEPGKFSNFKLEINEFIYNPQKKITEKKPIDLENVDEKDGMAWLEAINQIYKLTDARFKSLITWSHGGVISISNPDPPQENDFNIIRNHKKYQPDFDRNKIACSSVTEYENAVRLDKIKLAQGPDCTTLKQLFISEIGKGLAAVTRNNKFDFAIMTNCNTQVIDNCYNLHGITNYYMAPITAIQLVGFDFIGFIKHVNGNTPTNNFSNFHLNLLRLLNNFFHKKIYYKAYAKRIIQMLISGYKERNPNEQKSEAIFANDLQKAYKIKDLLNPICCYFMENKEKTYPVILDVLNNKIDPVTDICLFDALTLFTAIKEDLNCKKFSVLCNTFSRFILKEICFQKAVGEELLNPGKQDKKSGYSAFSIYVPVVSATTNPPEVFTCQYLRTFLNPQFVKDTKWDNFIISFSEWQVAAHPIPQ